MKWQVFTDRKGETKKLKEWIIIRQCTFSSGAAGGPIEQVTLLVLTRKFQKEWFKMPLLGERLDLQSG